MRANQALREWTLQCKEYEQLSRLHSKEKKREKVNDYEVMEEEGEDEAPPASTASKRTEEFPPLIPNEVTNVPFPGLLLTRSFTYFLQFHNEKLPGLLSGKNLPCLLIDNYEYLLRLNGE